MTPTPGTAQTAMRFSLHLSVLPVSLLARRLVLCCLLLALPVYGLSSVLVQLLGAQHRHQSAGSPADGNRDAGPLGTGWEQRFRAAMAHESGPVARQDGDAPLQTAAYPAAHSAAPPALQTAAAPHDHGVFERHHHDGDDASVVPLGASLPAGEVSTDAGNAGAGSATLPLALAGGLLLALPRAAPCCWPRAGTAPWQSRPPERLERPPRG